MKAVWVTRSFLDYRLPVYEAVSSQFNHQFALVYNADYVPDRCCQKANLVLGSRAIGLRGEFALKLGPQAGFANRGLRLPYQRGLVEVVLRQQPDVVISDGFFQWTYAALWLRAIRKIPHVMCYEKTRHTERNAQWFRRIYRRQVLRWIDAVSCNGRLSGEYTQHLGYPAGRITYGHMVADTEGIQASARAVPEQVIAETRAQLGLKGTVFLYVGRLIALKGLHELLAAWAQFCVRSGGEHTLLIVGHGPERESLEVCCRQKGLENVRFSGGIDYDRLGVFYRSANAFVIPTLEDNWSLVVPEAMACGLPILCSRYNGCWPELVTDANGWVFDPNDLANVTDVLCEAASSPNRLAEMGKCSQAIVQNHTPQHAARAIVKACEMAYSRLGNKKILC